MDDLARLNSAHSRPVTLSAGRRPDASLGIRSDESRPFVVGDNAAVCRDSTIPAPHETQQATLAEILNPVLGDRAERQARILLDAFGSIGGVSAASPDVLGHVLGDDRDLAVPLSVSRRMLEIGMRERIEGTRISSDDHALLEWLIARFSGMADECLIAIYVDRSGAFLCDETFRSGAEAWVVIQPRTLFRQAMRLDCQGILLAHNHPSGDPRPSILDIETTRRIAAHGRLLDVELVDHLVVARNSVTSMKRAGLL